MMWPRSARSFRETVCFDPIITPTLTAIGLTEAAAATASTAITTAAMVGTAAVGAASALSAGNQQSAMHKYNAAVQNNNALSAERAGAAEADRMDRQHRQQIASGVAAAGASGVDPNSGSPLEVVADLAGQAKLDEELVRWQARERARGFAAQAATDTMQARMAKTAGYMNAGSSILSAFTSRRIGGR